MPADGISLPPRRGDFGTSRWAGSKGRLHQPRDSAEGGTTAHGTKRTYRDVCCLSAFVGKADIHLWVCERPRLPLVVSEATYDLSVGPACAYAGRTIVVFLRHTRIGVVEHSAG